MKQRKRKHVLGDQLAWLCNDIWWVKDGPTSDKIFWRRMWNTGGLYIKPPLRRYTTGQPP